MDFIFLAPLLFLLIAVIFIALGFPLKLAKVPPNVWYGFRTRKSLSNEAIWYEINRISGSDMIKIGLVLGVSSLMIMPLRRWIGADVAIGLLTALLLACVAWMAIRGLSLLGKM